MRFELEDSDDEACRELLNPKWHEEAAQMRASQAESAAELAASSREERREGDSGEEQGGGEKMTRTKRPSSLRKRARGETARKNADGVEEFAKRFGTPASASKTLKASAGKATGTKVRARLFGELLSREDIRKLLSAFNKLYPEPLSNGNLENEIVQRVKGNVPDSELTRLQQLQYEWAAQRSALLASFIQCVRDLRSPTEPEGPLKVSEANRLARNFHSARGDLPIPSELSAFVDCRSTPSKNILQAAPLYGTDRSQIRRGAIVVFRAASAGGTTYNVAKIDVVSSSRETADVTICKSDFFRENSAKCAPAPEHSDFVDDGATERAEDHVSSAFAAPASTQETENATPRRRSSRLAAFASSQTQSSDCETSAKKQSVPLNSMVPLASSAAEFREAAANSRARFAQHQRARRKTKERAVPEARHHLALAEGEAVLVVFEDPSKHGGRTVSPARISAAHPAFYPGVHLDGESRFLRVSSHTVIPLSAFPTCM